VGFDRLDPIYFVAIGGRLAQKSDDVSLIVAQERF
jgi:hypothetical protein